MLKCTNPNNCRHKSKTGNCKHGGWIEIGNGVEKYCSHQVDMKLGKAVGDIAKACDKQIDY